MTKARRAGLAAVAVAAGLLLSACSPALAGTAALVGATRITTDELHSLTARSLADPAAEQRYAGSQAKLAEFQRTQLGRLIQHQLLLKAAARYGVRVSAGDVDARMNAFIDQAGGRQQLEQQAAAAGVAPADLRGFIADLVLQDALADKLVASETVSDADLKAAYEKNIDQYDQVHAAHILVSSKQQADQILAQVRKNPAAFAGLAAKFSQDPGSKDQGGDLGTQPASAFVADFSKAVFGAKPGAFVEVHTQFGWHVVHVIERKTVPLAQAAPALRQQLLSNTRDQRLTQALTDEAKQLGVKVNPRFGSWSEAQRAVLAPKDLLSTPAAKPGG